MTRENKTPVMNKSSVIQNLQTFGIILVVLGHSIPSGNIQTYPNFIIWAHGLIYSFHMPLFMFISGYLFIYTNRDKEINWCKFIKDKAVRLLIPYWSMTTLAFVPKVILSHYASRPVDFSLTGYIRGLAFPYENPLLAMWFLPALFIIFIVAPFIKHILVKKKLFISALIMIVCILMNILNPVRTALFALPSVFDYFIYFYSGCFVSFHAADHIRKTGSLFYAIVLQVLLIASNILFTTPRPKGAMIATAFCGIAFSISLCAWLEKNKLMVLPIIDGYSYQIFLLSWFIQISFRLLYQMNYLNAYLCLVLMLLGGIFIPMVIAKIIENNFPKLRIFIGLK